VGGRGGKDNQRVKVTEPERREEKKEEREEKQRREPTREEIRKMSGAELREYVIEREKQHHERIEELSIAEKNLTEKRDFLLYDQVPRIRIDIEDIKYIANQEGRELTEREKQDIHQLGNTQLKTRNDIEKLNKKIDQIREEKRLKEVEHSKTRLELFETVPGSGITIQLDIGKRTSLYTDYWETVLKPQKEFLERVVARGEGQQSGISFHVKGRAGGGGEAVYHENTVRLGMENVYGTSAIHEFTHMIEHKTPGAVGKRSERVKELLERRFGKPVEEIELREWVAYVDERGKKHHFRKEGRKVWIPKDLQFESSAEETEFGYMFRVYEHQTKTRLGKRYISTESAFGWGLGEEVLPKSAEFLYREPKRLAEKFPDVFELAIDLFRRK